jgi:hypothetical protein
MLIQRLGRSACVALLALGFLIPASSRGGLIDFDSQGLFGPPFFADAGPAQTLNITTSVGVVTFQGGVILTAESSGVNTSSVYATALVGNLTNPITITFPIPLTNFSIEVCNGQPSSVSYLIADNAGHSQAFALPLSGIYQANFANVGTVITIMSVTAPSFPPLPYPDPWSFAIDSISFEAVPEPSSIALAVAGLGSLALLMRRKLR